MTVPSVSAVPIHFPSSYGQHAAQDAARSALGNLGTAGAHSNGGGSLGLDCGGGHVGVGR